MRGVCSALLEGVKRPETWPTTAGIVLFKCGTKLHSVVCECI